MNIKTIGVVGAGTMGTGIAQVAAMKGYNVILRDIKMEYVESSVTKMAKLLDKSVKKERITEIQKNDALDRITKTDKLEDFKDADLIIEAVLENMDLKKSIFSELNGICKEDTIFATNTSSMSVTEIASASGRPDRFCGIHFFNPVPVMKLVEVIYGMDSSKKTIEMALEFSLSLGKTPVEVKKDSPGFIVNRLLIPYMNEAARLLEEGVASVEDIDTAVKLGLNYPMGPFQMFDFGGIDLSVIISEYFRDEFNDLGYAPQLILKQMIRAGKTGMKCGEGFYKYE
ncbi:3-hydroxybutyryl-CoA dehydrogenase [Dethiosulfatibacter aminovorans DSM 17477]|uniref:3-hydroxybutyryl-CoA dehydrogenase n=1 Tax=Dethiosulfatibacter aminovorans DSM 17477 TaxID=1121476 RepID=A0A1M6BYH2_9FIRM|nr:3-hydroxyacyl-CoA dehydrogenase NAD-binding domain-containing protein [Dethiosulfatibacter aminovorans]SHI53790.1 3-hydroxybutyryl-CoA dehydrogenase [Dethiosulfatibacter aminovorans DSM 17477]